MKSFMLISLVSLCLPVFAQTHGTYAPARPVYCHEEDSTYVHRMRVFLIEDSNDEFVVHLESRQGRCQDGRFASEPLDHRYETTFIPERFYFREPFDADFDYTEHPNIGTITMRFKKSMFKRRADHDLNFYFGVHGKTRYPLYFKWYVSVSRGADNKIKFNMNYRGRSTQP